MQRSSPGRALLAGTLLAFVLAGAGATASRANGRLPALVNVRFQPNSSDTIIVAATFGLLISRDGGQSFRWVCEMAVGYGGINGSNFDPDYAVNSEGDIY